MSICEFISSLSFPSYHYSSDGKLTCKNIEDARPVFSSGEGGIVMTETGMALCIPIEDGKAYFFPSGINRGGSFVLKREPSACAVISEIFAKYIFFAMYGKKMSFSEAASSASDTARLKIYSDGMFSITELGMFVTKASDYCLGRAVLSCEPSPLVPMSPLSAISFAMSRIEEESEAHFYPSNGMLFAQSGSSSFSLCALHEPPSLEAVLPSVYSCRSAILAMCAVSCGEIFGKPSKYPL